MYFFSVSAPATIWKPAADKPQLMPPQPLKRSAALKALHFQNIALLLLISSKGAQATPYSVNLDRERTNT